MKYALILLVSALLSLPALAKKPARSAACHEGYNCRGRVLFYIPGDTAIAESCLAAGGNSISAPAKKRCFNITPGYAPPSPPPRSCLPPEQQCLETQCDCCSGVSVLIGNSC